MNCPICNQELPDEAKFCFKCKNQIVCTKCEKEILNGASICVYCGTPTTQVGVLIMNQFEFKDDNDGRTIKATFTDNTANSFVETLSQFTQNNIRFHPKTFHEISLNEIEAHSEIEEKQSFTVKNEDGQKNIQTDNNSELSILNGIFKSKDNAIYLNEARLKGKNRNDHMIRLSILFLYYKTLLGSIEIKRSELNAVLTKENLCDGGFRSWLTKNKHLLNIQDKNLSLRPEGIEKAKLYVKDLIDSSLKESWSKKSNGANKNSSSNAIKTSTKTGANSSNKSFKLLGNLNLNPKGKKSLKDYISIYIIKNNFMSNLLFVYYLKSYCSEIGSITLDHIYTCYKNVSIKAPLNLYQSIIDTKNRKGWLDTTNMNDIKITTGGENAVEHEFKRSSI
jgi:hypothetical protein